MLKNINKNENRVTLFHYFYYKEKFILKKKLDEEKSDLPKVIEQDFDDIFIP